MKTISITIDEELDARVAAEAKRRGMSKSEYFRLSVATALPESDRTDQPTGDPLVDLAGFASYDSHGEHHDTVIYGQ
jgi:Ribbon-helix-helix protein, copG family